MTEWGLVESLSLPRCGRGTARYHRTGRDAVARLTNLPSNTKATSREAHTSTLDQGPEARNDRAIALRTDQVVTCMGPVLKAIAADQPRLSFPTRKNSSRGRWEPAQMNRLLVPASRGLACTCPSLRRRSFRTSGPLIGMSRNRCWIFLLRTRLFYLRWSGRLIEQ